MNRRFPASFLAVLLLTATDAAQEEEVRPQRRSVLFWLTDTTRADRLSAYGHGRETTPFLERLAADGVLFENCFSQAPWTKPSMAAILTGQYATSVGIGRLLERLDPSVVTAPEVLQEHGWDTAGFSANPVVGKVMSNFGQGFRWFTECSQILPGGDPIRYASNSTKAVAGHVLEYLDENEAWPFFLYAHSLDPHEEYRPSPEHLALFGDPEQEPAYREQWARLMETHGGFGNYCTQGIFDEAGVEAGPFLDFGRNLYDADVRAFDDGLAAVWEGLGERGIREGMILVVTADHGEEFFEHGATSHGHSLYNEMIRVPLILWAPGLLPQGLRIREPVRSIDVMPTLLDLLELPPLPDAQGQSLLPWIRNRRATDRREVFSEKVEDPTFPFMQGFRGEEAWKRTGGSALSLVSGPWKFILNLKSPYGLEVPRHELYHLARDPGERSNVAAEHPDLVEKFEEQVLRQAAENVRRRIAPGTTDPEALDPGTVQALKALGYLK